MKKPKSKRALARKIATALFTDPWLGKATRLQLRFADPKAPHDTIKERAGCGLCYIAAVAVIEKHL